jgi:[NiFe] hydrogenase assembly HybE family chaperone
MTESAPLPLAQASGDRPCPDAALQSAFGHIARQRMAGVPIVNPALKVEAVGFRPWNEHWLGVLVTPWFMNLWLMPRVVAHWKPITAGTSRHYVFPAGVFEFIGGFEATIGDYQACSLFSPMFDFADPDAARAVAAAAREALLVEPPGAPAEATKPAAAHMTKRDFLSLGRHEPGR